MKKYFEISYEMVETLSVDDIWPDGDAPENPAVDDVKAEMRKCGNPRQWMYAWSMEPDWSDIDVEDVTEYMEHVQEAAEKWYNRKKEDNNECARRAKTKADTP